MAGLKDVGFKESNNTVVLKDGNEYTLSFSLNAMAEMEDRYGSVEAAFKAMEGNSFKAIRFMLWAATQDAHPELTEKSLGALIDIADLERITEAINGTSADDLPDVENIAEVKEIESPNL